MGASGCEGTDEFDECDKDLSQILCQKVQKREILLTERNEKNEQFQYFRRR